MRRRLLSALILTMTVTPCRAAESAPGLRVPPGFEVTEYADSSLANDIFSMTLDPRGRVVVSGRGYVRILVEDPKTGRAARAIDFADGPKEGAQGMLWEDSRWLYFTADGGLRRYPVRPDGDGAAGPSELVRAMKTGNEHGSHAIKRGPDCWLYVLGGNNSGIDKTYAQRPASPIREPIAGCVLRFTPDLKACEIVADGFRNPYDMDFNPDGALFTFDSDNERCVSLPWYEGTRFYHVIPGGHYGWLNPQRADTWRRPPYFPDVVAPLMDLGRGSPTGVACYRHVQFPEAYHGGFFLLDWTFGKVYFMTLARPGPTYTCRKQVFLESVGDNGFAPTAAVVHPKTGDLFISIGGRGTRGAVYRVRYPARFGKADPAAVARLQPRHGPLQGTPTDLSGEFLRQADTAAVLHRAAEALSKRDGDPKIRLAWVRAVQRTLGDLCSPKRKGTVWEGYSLRQEPPPSRELDSVRAALREAFPSGDANLDREIGRTLAALEDDDTTSLRKIVDRLTASSNPVDDIHDLIVLARLRAPRTPEITKRVAQTLLALDRKLTDRHAHRDRNWPLRIAETHAELARRDPNLNAALLADPDFGRPDHALFAKCLGFDRRRAAERFLRLAKEKGDEFPWTADLVNLIGDLPPEQATPVLRELWGKAGLDEAVLPVLARQPRADDRAKFLEGLGSPRMATVRQCLAALEKLPPPTDGANVLPAIRCLRSLSDGKEEKPLREKVAQYLRRVTGQGTLGADREAWTKWFAAKYPALADRLANADGVDVAGWDRRLGGLDWSAGDAARGRAVFVKASCASCHSGAQAIGPDLRGVAGRFSRADLFTAIIQPSKDISPRYRTTLIAAANGKIYQGLVIYEAVDGLLLQTGPAATVRIPSDQIVTRRFTATSLMPTGLLDKLADREITDLYAYLKGLK